MLSSCFYRLFSTTATPSSLLILLDQHLLPTSGLQIWKIMILQLPLRKPGLGQKNLYSFLLCLYFIYLGRVFRSRELPVLLPPPSHPSWELVLLLCFQLECLRVRSGALGYTRYTCESSGHRLCFPKSHCSQQVVGVPIAVALQVPGKASLPPSPTTGIHFAVSLWFKSHFLLLLVRCSLLLCLLLIDLPICARHAQYLLTHRIDLFVSVLLIFFVDYVCWESVQVVGWLCLFCHAYHLVKLFSFILFKYHIHDFILSLINEPFSNLLG